MHNELSKNLSNITVALFKENLVIQSIYGYVYVSNVTIAGSLAPQPYHSTASNQN